MLSLWEGGRDGTRDVGSGIRIVSMQLYAVVVSEGEKTALDNLNPLIVHSASSDAPPK